LEISVMSSDLVLVTGASGYVAGHCMLRLLHDGYRVRGTLRSLQRAGEVRQWLTAAAIPKQSKCRAAGQRRFSLFSLFERNVISR
jgi:nucleoside-diphosphate-sugar epimerase